MVLISFVTDSREMLRCELKTLAPAGHKTDYLFTACPPATNNKAIKGCLFVLLHNPLRHLSMLHKTFELKKKKKEKKRKYFPDAVR